MNEYHLQDYPYSNPLLASVYSLPEAVAIWKKTRNTVILKIARGELEARKVGSGGSIIITRQSLVKLWGEPDYDPVQENLIESSSNGRDWR